MKCPNLKQLVLLIFEMIKKWSPTLKHACCVTYESYEKQNHDNVKSGNKNVNVVEKNYIEAEK